MADTPLIIGPPRESGGTAVFERADSHTLQHGVIVMYRVRGFNFAIVAHRGGVQVSGIYPNCQREGVVALQDMLRRAVQHHEHLATFEVGTKQTPLDESLLSDDAWILGKKKKERPVHDHLSVVKM